ncbi:hypothetical protein AGMMS50212_13590 [Spirochaetia bacterium]|nr:hypothetical protein AGMMS50212_13590 [Spirochaetia bacterium]
MNDIDYLPDEIKSLHSKYNPEREAERYVETLPVSNKVKYFILVECGLCYVIKPLREKYPTAKIISLHLRTFNADNSKHKADAVWKPDLNISRTQFLENEIEDVEALYVKIIEWRPAVNVYKEEYAALMSDIVKFISRIDANKKTVLGFGRRWSRNILKNCSIIKNIAKIKTVDHDCIVAGAGPSLGKNIEQVRALKKNGCILFAVSSAAPCLIKFDIVPDVVVASDGGTWALLHLFECIRKKHKFIIAAALNAALPSQCSMYSVLPIGDGSALQNDVLNTLGANPVNFPQRGTVSAAALDLAFYLCTGNVYITGVDLSNDDIQTHSKPYSFDALLMNKSNRLNPMYHQQYIKTHNSFNANKIYADWFKEQIKKYPARLYSLMENNKVFLGMEAVNG